MTANGTQFQYKHDDLVWVNVPKWNWWPGMVCEPPEKEMKAPDDNIERQLIYLFEVQCYTWVEMSNLKAYLPYKRSMVWSNNHKSFQQACALIEDHIKNTKRGVSTANKNRKNFSVQPPTKLMKKHCLKKSSQK